MATTIASPPRPRAIPTILGGGLLAGLLDGTDAIIYFGLKSNVSAGRIFHYIASGLIGIRASIQLGWLGVILGVILQFTIAIGGAAVYYFAALKLPILIRRPFLSGTIFGLGLYTFMNLVVVPLSAVPKNPHPTFSWIDLASGLFAHIVLIGIPIALIAQRSARVKPPGA
ncbi:MAG TPA: hypothetical protein VMA71_06785 [Alloacidobacterium sp.]|nr:hypothetical protein [Alloacidobacterium sp.]